VIDWSMTGVAFELGGDVHIRRDCIRIIARHNYLSIKLILEGVLLSYYYSGVSLNSSTYLQQCMLWRNERENCVAAITGKVVMSNIGIGVHYVCGRVWESTFSVTRRQQCQWQVDKQLERLTIRREPTQMQRSS